MMKQSITFLFFLAIIQSLFAQMKNDFKPGIIILKVKKEHRKSCEIDRINLPDLDTVIAKINGKKISKIFPHHIPPVNELNANGDKLVDLSLIYRLNFNSEVALKKVAEMLIKTGKIEYAEPERVYHILDIPNDPMVQPGADLGPFDFVNHTDHFTADHYSVVHAYEAWDISKGDPSVLIGDVDTGVEWYHEDLVDNLFQNLGEDNDRDGRTIEKIDGVWQYDPDDMNGIDDDSNGYIDDVAGTLYSPHNHGTETAGLLAATPNNGKGIAGTGYNCRYIPVTGLSMWGVVYAADMGAKVINCSWGTQSSGCDGYLNYEDDMVNYVTNNKDAVMVAAAGNNGIEVHYWPASYSNVLCVSATVLKNFEGEINDDDGHLAITDEKATWATYNTEVDIVAPGSGPVSTTVGNSYYLGLQGTSFSCPIVAGAAALVRSKYPQLNQAQVRELLRMTADDIYNVSWNIDYFEKMGKGRLNMYRALTELQNTVATRATAANISSCSEHQISCDFTNYLKPTFELKVTLSTTTQGITIVNPTITLGALATLGKKLDQVFTIVVDPSILTLPQTGVKFRLGYSDVANNYSDYQYFCIDIDGLRDAVNTSKILGGPKVICAKDKEGVYYVDATAGSIYEWKVPYGATITSDPTLNSVNITFAPAFNGGDITVQETTSNGCRGIIQKLTIVKLGNCKPVTECGVVPSWSTFFGSSKRESVNGITTDPDTDDIIIIGGTEDWQTLPSGTIPTKTYGPKGVRDVFVAKISSDGSSLLWVTVLGSTGLDEGYKVIANNSNNSVFISGKSGGIDFPIIHNSKGISNTYGSLGGECDAFVAMLSLSDGNVTWSTLYGGKGLDNTYGISYHRQSGAIYLAGQTSSSDLPLKTNSFGGINDAYCSKINGNNGDLIWSTYLGGAGVENCFGSGLDNKGNPFISGISNQYFKVMGAVTNGSTIAGDYDVIVGNFDQKTGKVIWHSFTGGAGYERTMDMVVTRNNDVLIVGSTNDIPGDYNNIMLANFNGTTGILNYFKSFGGSNDEEAQALTIDGSDNIYITGTTRSVDFIESINPIQPYSYRSNNTGSNDIFVIKFFDVQNPITEWATYYGSNPLTGPSLGELGHGIAIDKSGNVIVGGATFSSNFETMNSPIQPEFNLGEIDGFVLKLNACSSPVSPRAKFSSTTESIGNSIVFPNPFTHNVNLVLDGFSGNNLKMEIFDTKGVKVFEKDGLSNGNNLEIGENFEAGIYFIKIISITEIKTYKVVKNP